MFLLSRGARVNAQDRELDTPLQKAVWNRDIKTAEVLVQAGADVNLRNARNRSPLMAEKMQARDGRSPMLKLLRAFGGRE